MTEREPWTYEVAFGRNLGLVSRDEQARLRQSTVAIAGAGGVGGGHALALARQGVGGFRLADPDTFSVANINRQMGARVSSLGLNKAEELRRMILDINPEARVDVWPERLGAHNVDAFLDGVDVVLDGVDVFAIEARRLLFARARARGLWAMTAGPLGFSTAVVAFSPGGMSFDAYCGFTPDMSPDDQIMAFLVALTPRPTHIPYMDFSFVDVTARTGPSAGLACLLCNAVLAMEALCVILGWRPPRAAPGYMQFDPRRRLYRQGTVLGGGRNPLQRLKRLLVKRHFRRLGLLGEASTPA